MMVSFTLLGTNYIFSDDLTAKPVCVWTECVYVCFKSTWHNVMMKIGNARKKINLVIIVRMLYVTRR